MCRVKAFFPDKTPASRSFVSSLDSNEETQIGSTGPGDTKRDSVGRELEMQIFFHILYLVRKIAREETIFGFP